MRKTRILSTLTEYRGFVRTLDSFFVIYSSEWQGCKRIGTSKKYANVFKCRSDVFQNAHTFNWKAFLRKFHLILFFWFIGMVLILNQVPSFTGVFNQLWPKNSKTMVTISFRNFTLQFKTFLGYFEKTNKPENKQRSWVLRPAFYLLY